MTHIPPSHGAEKAGLLAISLGAWSGIGFGIVALIQHA
ncbi:MAG: hypothetical protein JWO65_816 [Sphingomonas bacterium]|jgi:hypothetical protein|nr:hypothetical protein [Sphingomonas bacterium]